MGCWAGEVVCSTVPLEFICETNAKDTRKHRKAEVERRVQGPSGCGVLGALAGRLPRPRRDAALGSAGRQADTLCGQMLVQAQV